MSGRRRRPAPLPRPQSPRGATRSTRFCGPDPKVARRDHFSTMTPPEVILDRFVRTRLCHNPGCRGYIGKLDIDRVQSPSFRAFLYLVQETMNEALRQEGVNASGGVVHRPFHFDYLDVADASANAHAFQHEDSAFIVVTLPMVELVWRLTHALSRSPRIRQLLSAAPDSLDADSLQGLLFQIQLNFLVSHEYTHHVHGHCVDAPGAMAGLWTEFLGDAKNGNLKAQAQELDADGYAIYLALAHLLRRERRETRSEEHTSELQSLR